MASHLRLSAPNWTTFTGNFGGVEFDAGVSKTALNRQQIDKLSALIRCDLCDAEGAGTSEQAGVAARLVGLTSVPAEIGTGNTPGMRKATQDDMDTDARDRAANSGRAPTRLYSMQELETIASKEGIVGLRKIGDAWNVRDRSINKLIALILGAQKSFTVVTTTRDALILAQRASAQKEMLAKQAARDADIQARSRLVQPGGTSNAIGPNGENVTVNLTINTADAAAAGDLGAAVTAAVAAAKAAAPAA